MSFARLRTLARPQDDAAKSINQLSKALSGLGKPVRLHVELVSGPDGGRVQHWDVQGGAKSGKVKRGKPKDADVVVVMRPETWAQIAQGQLAPYEALYIGQAARRRRFRDGKDDRQAPDGSVGALRGALLRGGGRWQRRSERSRRSR